MCNTLFCKQKWDQKSDQKFKQTYSWNAKGRAESAQHSGFPNSWIA